LIKCQIIQQVHKARTTKIYIHYKLRVFEDYYDTLQD